MKMILSHYHLCVNGYLGNVKSRMMMSEFDANIFVKDLLRKVKMKPLGKLNWSDAIDKEYPGQSFTQMITTSHTSMHIFEYKNNIEFYFDLYSCKKFEVGDVIEIIKKHFPLLKWKATFTKRDAVSTPEITIYR